MPGTVASGGGIDIGAGAVRVMYVTDVHNGERTGAGRIIAADGVNPDVVSVIGASRIIPVVVLDDVRAAEPLGAALVAGGLGTVEVTFRTDAAVDAIAVMSRRADPAVGARAVITPAQGDRADQTAARFV